MRAIGVLIFAAAAVWAQQPAEQTYISAGDVQKLIANAKKTRKPDQPTLSQPLLVLKPYQASLEYRGAVGPAAIHEKEAEMFYVVEGSGTLVTGGKLVNEKRTNAENLSGTAIEGGKSQAMSKGDFAIVPENTAHWFSQINGTLVLMSLHLPRR